jgi:hypothetical protein
MFYNDDIKTHTASWCFQIFKFPIRLVKISEPSLPFARKLSCSAVMLRGVRTKVTIQLSTRNVPGNAYQDEGATELTG